MSKLAPPVNESVRVQSVFTVYDPNDPLEWMIVPFMLTMANGLTSVPSPLKSMPSTMAFGTATPPTIFHPCVANRYELRRVCTPQLSPRLSARAVPGLPIAIATIRPTTAHAQRKKVVLFLTNFVFISFISCCCFGLLWLPTVRSHFRPFSDVQNGNQLEVMRKLVEAAVPAARRRVPRCRR